MREEKPEKLLQREGNILRKRSPAARNQNATSWARKQTYQSITGSSAKSVARVDSIQKPNFDRKSDDRGQTILPQPL